MRTLLFCLAAWPVQADPLPEIPFQTLVLDPAHAAITVQVSHLGYSSYTFGFDRFDATLDFGTDRPEDAQLTAIIDVASLDLPTPPPGFRDQLLGAAWFDVTNHPQIIFRSDSIEVTGANRGEVRGAMAMLGQTAPVTFDVIFNGGYADAPWENYARIGFSATGTLERSAFGLTNGLPAPGTTLGVGDTVTFVIEAEFIGKSVTSD